MQILATDNGPHPAEKWAHVTTQEILAMIEIAEGAPPSASIDKMEFEVRLLRVLAEGHRRIQEVERSALADSHDRLLEKLQDQNIANETVSNIVKASSGTMFADHFRKNSTSAHLHEVVTNHFASSMHVERLWHTDRNPDHPNSQAYRAHFGALAPLPEGN